MRIKKSLGQNFLRDEKILRKIADFAQIDKEDMVVEIGPGEGTLTKLLLERAKKVIAIEKDKKLAEKIREKFKYQISNNKLKIISGDILEPPTGFFSIFFEEKSAKREKNLVGGGSYKLVGNIPYYITGAIFKKFLQNPPAGVQPESITFVVQKEVAKRIIASHSAKASRDKHKESILSISIKAYGKPEYGGVIKAGSFYPKPKVDSAIIAIRDINKKKFKEIDEKKFFEILKKGFAHKRKLLIKNLGISEKNLKKIGIYPKARAEDLKIEDWFRLAKIINNINSTEKT
ncbi:MAG: ribosomal RNA small subunit methyltransferase A [Candidatus Zambryskibacteria bacterium]|nr:ribosomal RNA small subunit methyltransferase A [Candidatus Zambryskibacteria bacterium]